MNRLDSHLAEKGIVKSRSTAADLIKRGRVTINGIIAKKPSVEVSDTDVIVVTEPQKYVSRSGEKLEAALTTWNINVTGKTVLDIGASTGGFTDCLLQRGATKVYAVDVGTDQLDAKIKNDQRVIPMEKTDIRMITLPETVDMIVIDVSFISIIKIFESAYKALKKGGIVVTLVKPQFEVGADRIRKGFVVDDVLRTTVIEEVKHYAQSVGFTIEKQMPCPVIGEKGNREELLCLRS
jgi:23S rRNA (cytidine1920-2'-O)/16S rRNA (cytidine1409-2'-O)-methyltransferase